MGLRVASILGKAIWVARKTPGTYTAPSDQRPQRPGRLLRASAPKRHQLDRFTEATRVDRNNTMVLPGIDIEDEIARINQGEGVSIGNNRWQINERVYVDKGTGATFPESGSGVISPSRRDLIALQHLIRSGGDIADLFHRTIRDPNFDDTIRARAKDLYDIWREAREKRT